MPFRLHKILQKLKIIFFVKYCITSKGNPIYPGGKVENLSNNPKKIRIGKNCVIKGKLLVFAHDGEIIIGDNVFIGERTEIWSSKSIRIGNNVQISHDVNIADTNSHPIDYELRSLHFLEIIKNGHPKNGRLVDSIIAKPIIIDDYAWIGHSSSIKKGVKIGKKSIISSNSIVFKNVPANKIYYNKINPFFTNL
jgi:acetyltransferase-like isoleucine patch superfamily enzyme